MAHHVENNFQPFTETDYDYAAGVESPNPMIKWCGVFVGNTYEDRDYVYGCCIVDGREIEVHTVSGYCFTRTCYTTRELAIIFEVLNEVRTIWQFTLDRLGFACVSGDSSDWRDS